MNLKNNKLKALSLVGITGTIMTFGGGCANVNWTDVTNTTLNLVNATGNLMNGIAGITGSVQDKKQTQALENIADQMKKQNQSR